MKSEVREAAVWLLMTRGYFYRLMQSVWAEEPNRDRMVALADPYVQDVLELLTTEAGPDMTRFAPVLTRLRSQMVQNEAEALRALNQQYEALMIQQDAPLPAPPWEWAYRHPETGEALSNRLGVRLAYLRYEFVEEGYSTRADGHIALQLGYMARLCSLTQKALEFGNDERVAMLLGEQRDFLTEHLLLWAPQWARQIAETDGPAFYSQMAALLADYLTVDLQSISDVEAVL